MQLAKVVFFYHSAMAIEMMKYLYNNMISDNQLHSNPIIRDSKFYHSHTYSYLNSMTIECLTTIDT